MPDFHPRPGQRLREDKWRPLSRKSRFDQSFRCRHYSLLLFDQYFSVPRAVSSVVESAGAATGVTHTTARVADSAELRLRSEIENHARAQHDQQKSDEEQ